MAQRASAVAWAGRYGGIRFSPDGLRVALYSLALVIVIVIEIDLATRKIVHRFDAGLDQVTGVTYHDGELVVSRSIWEGELWTAQGELR